MKYRTLAKAKTGELDSYAPELGGESRCILEYTVTEKAWNAKLKSHLVKEGKWFPVEVEVLEDGTII